MKKIIFPFVLLMICMIIAGCGSETTENKAGTPSEAQNTDTPTVSLTDHSTIAPTTAKETAAGTSSAVPTATETETKSDTPTATTTTSGTDGTIVFTCGEGTAKAGGEVTLDIVISDNPGIAGYSFTLLYDAEKLEFVKVENKVEESFGTINSKTSGKVRIMRTVSGGNLLDMNGVCCSVTLKVKEDVSPCEIEIPIRIDDENDTVYTSLVGSSIEFEEYPSEFVSGTVRVVAEA